MRNGPDRTITFARISTVVVDDLIALMNDPDVKLHLPLAEGVFGKEECRRFVSAKEAHWATHGYGPWAFYVDGTFAGWGGLQVEGEDIDLGLILHRSYWGLAQSLYERFANEAFDQLGAQSVIVLLPLSRRNVAALDKAGFEYDGQVTLSGIQFQRFRLHNRSKPRPAV